MREQGGAIHYTAVVGVQRCVRLSVNTKNGWKAAARVIVLGAMLVPLIAACSGGGSSGGLGATVKRSAFTSKEFGVKVSPRVTNNPNPPRGGGRYLVGKPYTVRGKVYTPAEQPGYVAQGQASWYGSDFHGRRTANGEIFSANAITGAHPTLPLPSYVRVTNVENGRSVLVRINDRGPYMSGRIIDLSHKAADILGYVNRGMGNVHVQYVGPAPLNGDDTKMLMASIDQVSVLESPTTMLALAEPSNPAPMVFPATRSTTQVAASGSLGTYSASDLAKDVTGLFSYADAREADGAILSAHDAANAMAAQSPALDSWVEAVDSDARAVRLQIGDFDDSDRAIAVAEAFAMFGAVDEVLIESRGGTATRLTLTRLKPGVDRTDVLALARELGLNDLVSY